MRVFTSALVAIGLFSTAAWAQSPSTDDFVMKAAAGSNAEIQAGQLAATKGVRSDVKSFGKRMVKDHTQASRDLKKTLARAGKTPPADILTPEATDMMGKLNAASGADFDRMYVDAMIMDHDKDQQEFSTYMKSGEDKNVRGFASRTVRVIMHHNVMIHSIQKKMQRSAAN